MLKILVPRTIDVLNTNVTAEYPAWDEAVSYSAGDRVTYSGYIWECSIDNIDKNPAIYTGYGDITFPSAAYPTYDPNATYNDGDIVLYITTSYIYRDKFVVQPHNTTLIWTGEYYYTYVLESIESSNNENAYFTLIGNTGTKWKIRGFEWNFIGASNQYSAIYQNDIANSILNSLNTVMMNTGNIEIEINSSNMDSIALLGVESSSITIELIDKTTSEVYWSVEDSGYDVSSITDWYEYFTYEYVYKKNFFYQFPYLDNTKISITIEPPEDNISKVALIMVGKSISFGDVLMSPTYSIIDYSVKDVTKEGNVIIKEGKVRDEITMDILIPNGKFDYVVNKLKELRAYPVVWVASQTFTSLIVYGFHRDLDMNFITDKYSNASLTIESM